MKTFIKNLCDKLESWDINPNILAKAVSIFLIIAILVILMMTFPILFGILLIIAVCIAMIALIYLMLE